MCLSWVADTKSLQCLISDLAFDIVGLADLHPCAVGLRLWVGRTCHYCQIVARVLVGCDS